MNHILIGVCDDSPKDAKNLIEHLRTIETDLMLKFDIHTFSTGKIFLKKFCPVYDVLFLSLPVLDCNSQNLLSEIRKKDSEVKIFLMSKSGQWLQTGYEYGVKYYFKKPVSYFSLLKEMKKYLPDEMIITKPYIWISDQKGKLKLYRHKLRYIETTHRQLCFHYGDELIYQYGKLSELEQQLSQHGFFRSNNGYLVNIHYFKRIVKDVNRHSICLVTGERVPLSRSKRKLLENILNI